MGLENVGSTRREGLVCCSLYWPISRLTLSLCIVKHVSLEALPRFLCWGLNVAAFHWVRHVSRPLWMVLLAKVSNGQQKSLCRKERVLGSPFRIAMVKAHTVPQWPVNSPLVRRRNFLRPVSVSVLTPFNPFGTVCSGLSLLGKQNRLGVRSISRSFFAWAKNSLDGLSYLVDC